MTHFTGDGRFWLLEWIIQTDCNANVLLYCISSFPLSLAVSSHTSNTLFLSLTHISVTIITLSITYSIYVIAVALIKYVALVLFSLKHIPGLKCPEITWVSVQFFFLNKSIVLQNPLLSPQCILTLQQFGYRLQYSHNVTSFLQQSTSVCLEKGVLKKAPSSYCTHTEEGQNKCANLIVELTELELPLGVGRGCILHWTPSQWVHRMSALLEIKFWPKQLSVFTTT